jgi:predicted nucleic acid-binding protein
MILLDACVLLNLCATDRLEEIGRCVPGGFSVAAAAREEALFLRDPVDTVQPLKSLIINPFFERGILQELSLAANEESLFVNIAAELDEGEAMSMAIAIHRNLDLATDDRKALRLYANFGGDPNRLWSTLSVVKAWADRAAPSADELARAARAIRDCARYVPAPNHPLYSWWSPFVT